MFARRGNLRVVKFQALASVARVFEVLVERKQALNNLERLKHETNLNHKISNS